MLARRAVPRRCVAIFSKMCDNNVTTHGCLRHARKSKGRRQRSIGQMPHTKINSRSKRRRSSVLSTTAGLVVIQPPGPEPRIMRREITDFEWTAIRPPLPNESRGLRRCRFRSIPRGEPASHRNQHVHAIKRRDRGIADPVPEAWPGAGGLRSPPAGLIFIVRRPVGADISRAARLPARRRGALRGRGGIGRRAGFRFP
jgi:hypothetical protein